MPRKEKTMWDPISVFFCMWVLNIGLPEGRLNTVEHIKLKEQVIIDQTIVNSTTIRESI